MTTLEKICAELLTRWQEYEVSKDSAAAHERYMRFAGIHGMKLARACLILRKELEESLRVCDAAIDDIKYKEIKKNKTELMLDSCRKANDLALKKVNEILK